MPRARDRRLPKGPEVRLGESYHELGRRLEAKAALEEYMKIAPPNAAGRREVERLLAEL
jgi:hypothetical protein